MTGPRRCCGLAAPWRLDARRAAVSRPGHLRRAAGPTLDSGCSAGAGSRCAGGGTQRRGDAAATPRRRAITSPCARISSWRACSRARSRPPRRSTRCEGAGARAELRGRAERVRAAGAGGQAADAGRPHAAGADPHVPVGRAVSLPARRRPDGDRRHAGRGRRAGRGRTARAGPRPDAARARPRLEQPQAVRRGQDRAGATASSCSPTASKPSRRWRRPKPGSASSTPRRATPQRALERRAGERDREPRHGPGAHGAPQLRRRARRAAQGHRRRSGFAQGGLSVEPRLRPAGRRRRPRDATSSSIRRSSASRRANQDAACRRNV